VQRALRLWINEQINDRLKSALAQDPESAPPPQAEPAATTDPASTDQAAEVVTTEEEREAFQIVRAILRDMVSANRIAARDVKSYFSVLLDDNNRKPICRLYLAGSHKYVGLLDKGKGAEERVSISGIDDLFGFSERLRATVASYEPTLVPG